jgi:hypothetical protein
MPCSISNPTVNVFVNVPAIEALHSRFDDVLGHVRRYDSGLLSRHLVDAGLDVRSVRYWAPTMIAVIYARALLVKFFTEVGFKPPQSADSSCAIGALLLETWAVRSPPIGACLLAVAQKRPCGSG